MALNQNDYGVTKLDESRTDPANAALHLLNAAPADDSDNAEITFPDPTNPDPIDPAVIDPDDGINEDGDIDPDLDTDPVQDPEVPDQEKPD